MTQADHGQHRLLALHQLCCLQEDSDGCNALMLAAAGGHEAVVDLLLEAGVPWNAVDRLGRCAGDHASQNAHDTVYEAIVLAGELLASCDESAACTHCSWNTWVSDGAGQQCL